jgi:phosphatidylglycerophosphate synthase
MKEPERINSLSDLLTASRRVQWVNLVTLFRIVAFPVLLVLIFTDRIHIFAGLLILSFLTDAADGYLARKFDATSVLGARLDSIGDDLTILAAVVGLWVVKSDFILSEIIAFAIPFGFFLAQMILAFVRYGKMTSFHTYGAKAAAIFQGFFLCSMFLFDPPVYPVFYATAILTTLELIEEIIIVILLKEWKADVRGLYWVLRG